MRRLLFCALGFAATALPIFETAHSAPPITDANWINLGAFSQGVEALTVTNGDLYVGGNFLTVSNNSGSSLTVNHVAKWDGAGWSALGLGANNAVFAITTESNNVYAGGDFSAVMNNGGFSVAATRIARWDGTNWSAMGSGLGDQVHALAMFGGELYAGGGFGLRKWNGTNWLSAGIGNGPVEVLLVTGGNLYVGGGFLISLGDPGNRIAKWDGTSWSTFGTGMNNAVYAVAVSEGVLYAGGSFTQAGGGTARYIAKWNGSGWSSLGADLNGEVRALALSGSTLFTGGAFTVATNTGAATITVNHIARWDTTNWSNVGSGTSGTIEALAVSDNDLYAGGGFQSAGGKSCTNLARVRIGFLPDNLALKINVPGFQTNTLTFTGVPDYPYIVEYRTNLPGPQWTILSTNAPATNGIAIALDPAPDNSQRFYRVRTVE
jgi:hypothetical protein